MAKAAASEDGMQAIQLMRFTGLLENARASSSMSGATERKGTKADLPFQGPGVAAQVGIWERKSNSTSFVRRLDKASEWGFWANAGRIEAKGVRRRIVLIGESAARGYLFDPQFTPAMVLESILQSRLGKNNVEVIDLARTNISMEIRELAESALLLEPDAVIIFAGNNWGPSYNDKDVAFMYSAVLEKGIAGLKAHSEACLEREVTDLVRHVATAYQSRKVPLIWMVPEFNLKDWRDQACNAPYLGGRKNEQWLQHRKEAESALQNGNVALALQYASKMVELDQGSCTAGLYLLAECCSAAGDQQGAKRRLEEARDAHIWDPALKSPRAYAVTQRVVREEAARFGNEVVDLPGTFEEYLKGGIPDRRIFLDYCHLTSEGIQVSMAAASARVLRVLKGPESLPGALMHQAPDVPTKVKAEAAFLAAVHNAHWNQSYAVVRHYCRQALHLDPGIAGAMKHFAEMQTRQLPMLMCSAAEKIASENWPSIRHYLFRANNQVLDKLLLQAIGDSLKEQGDGLEPDLDELRKEEHGVSIRKRNLLDYYYGSSANQPREMLWVTPGLPVKPNHYYKAYSAESKFFFVGGGNSAPAELCLTFRVPYAASAKIMVRLRLNDDFEAELEAGGQWKTWSVLIAAEYIRNGLNEVVLHWPVPSGGGPDPTEKIAADILRGLKPEFYVVFGEIHMFTASGVLTERPADEVTTDAALAGTASS